MDDAVQKYNGGEISMNAGQRRAATSNPNELLNTMRGQVINAYVKEQVISSEDPDLESL